MNHYILFFKSSNYFIKGVSEETKFDLTKTIGIIIRLRLHSGQFKNMGGNSAGDFYKNDER